MRRAEPIAGVGGLLLLVALFLPWYGVEIPQIDTQFQTGNDGLLGVLDTYSLATASAWEAFSVIDIVLALLALLMLAVPVTSVATRGPAKAVAAAVLASAFGWLAVLLVLVRWVNPIGPNALIEPRYGLYLGLAGAVAGWVGAWLSLRDDSTPGAVAPDVPRRPAPPV
jgi:hypothetical protein